MAGGNCLVTNIPYNNLFCVQQNKQKVGTTWEWVNDYRVNFQLENVYIPVFLTM